jgi:four helix bundle protein
MAYIAFVNLRVYRLAEELADKIWAIALRWDRFARDTVGAQLVDAADSVGANIAEGTGRRSYRDNQRFVKIARGSLNETRHWLRRAYRRGLLKDEQVRVLQPLMTELAPKLNAYLRSIGPEAFATKNKEQRTKNKKSRATESNDV